MNNMNKQERDNKIIVEVCTGSYDDCIAASKGKADRVELNSALSVGGLTPTEAVLKRVKRILIFASSAWLEIELLDSAIQNLKRKSCLNRLKHYSMLELMA